MNKAMRMRKSVLEKYNKERALKLVEKAYDEGEPIFIIRGQDKVAWKAIKAYAELLKTASLGEGHGTPSYNTAEDAERYAAFVIEWQGLNQEKVKLPD